MILHIVISRGGVRNFIQNQIKTVSKFKSVNTYVISGRNKYLRTFFEFPANVNLGDYEILHGHYILTYPYLLYFGMKKKRVLSLMGSDVYSKKIILQFLRLLIRLDKSLVLIVKSRQMQMIFPKAYVIPNSVDPKFIVDSYTGRNLTKGKINILFPADKLRPEKNYTYFEYLLGNRNDVTVKSLQNVPYNRVIDYYEWADVVLLTSRYEGSPNVIKEAFALCKAIVSTNVGDVESIMDEINGCLVLPGDKELAKLSLNNFLDTIQEHLENIDLQERLERLSLLGLLEKHTVDKLISVYDC